MGIDTNWSNVRFVMYHFTLRPVSTTNVSETQMFGGINWVNINSNVWNIVKFWNCFILWFSMFYLWILILLLRDHHKNQSYWAYWLE